MTPLEIIRRKKIFRFVSAFMALNMLAGYFTPTPGHALTSGPGQEEFASFEPVSTSDMVDLYSGDFNYNIPLMSVPGPNGGYPINIAYHSGVGMDQEASWVGLGWNISVGAINRQMRGLPDDFNGDVVTNRYRMRENVTVAAEFNAGQEYVEKFGIPEASMSSTAMNFQLYYNSYKGIGYRIGYGGISGRIGSLGTVGAGVHFDSHSGVGVEPSFSLRTSERWWYKRISGGGSASINSREGLQSFGFSVSGWARGERFNKHGDRKNVMIGAMGSSSLSFSVGQEVPAATIPVSNVSVPFDLKFGEAGLYHGNNAIFGGFTSKTPGLWSGFVNVSRATEEPVGSPAYGYLFDRNALPQFLRDFQRENAEYSKQVPNLPSSNVTYDIFSMTGQGVGGYFRPYQQNVRTFSSQSRENETTVTRLNAEVGVDGIPGFTLDEYHIGLGFSLGLGGTSSGHWRNIETEDVYFQDDFGDFDETKDPLKEYAPFKMYGEKTTVLLSTEDQLSGWDNDNAVRVQLKTESAENTWMNSHFEATDQYSDGTPDYISTNFLANDLLQHKQQRERRATDIEYYSSQQSDDYGFTHYIGYDTLFDTGLEHYYLSNIGKSYESYAKPDHISEVSVLKPDGMRYTYGLPAYNTEQVDAYFSVHVNGSSFNTLEAAVPETSSEIDPSGTPDNFLSETNLPAYVHSWLLTSVVSADYLDITGDGPTDDDYGYWIRFNYSKTSGDYNWRVPYVNANFLVGNSDDVNDDKASFSFGKKELYYIQSIESKTHIAVFGVSPREDGVAADGKFAIGSLGTNPAWSQRMFKLDEVSLYTKAEYYLDIQNRVMRPVPEAIQTVHLRYSYDLCPGIPNNTLNDVDVYGNPVGSSDPDNINTAKGKLTLDSLFFTYGTSSRGAMSPYVFNYDNDNPSYARENMDRWGNYKDNSIYSGYYPYVDFPYTAQDITPPAGAWSLSSIDLPTGSRMDIEYEPDDYKYVEAKRAERMFDIIGTGASGGSFVTNRNTNSTEVGMETNAENTAGKFKVFFKLERAYLSDHTDTLRKFIREYFDEGKLDTVYFKACMNIKDGITPYYDYVNGYSRVSTDESDYGVQESVPSSGLFDIGYCSLLAEDIDRGPGQFNVHPFIRAALQHLHYNRSDIAFSPVPESPNAMNQVANFFGSVLQLTGSIQQMMMGYEKWAFNKGWGRKMRLNGWSVLRLSDPNKKFGGGDRVKRLSLTDTWDNDGSADNRDVTTYGQKYAYVLEDGSSSGVAYEPQIGGEENALRTPRPYEHSIPVKGTEHLFIEKPLMESYYPGPQVGYSRVVMQSIAPDIALEESESSPVNNLLHTAAPISIYEFYTPKDFPVLVDETPITADAPIVRPIAIPGIYTNYKKQVARSQGYSVVLNDMAGKLKSIEIRTRPTSTSPSLNASGSLISKQTFIYYTEQPYSADHVNKLSSKVQVMTCDAGVAKYQTGLVGQSHEVFFDLNENREYMWTRGGDANLDLQYNTAIPSAPPLVFLMPLVNISKTDIRQRTVVINKVIHRAGILKDVITTDHESTVKNTFVAFDQETGEPLLTRTTNEYSDSLYSFTYPAHWYYPAMRGAYHNFGVEFSASTAPGSFPVDVAANGRVRIDGNLPSGHAATEYFTVGDKVWVEFDGGGNGIYTVIKVGVDGSGDYFDCIDEAGNFISTADDIDLIRVIRSGYQNLQVLAAGAVTAKKLRVPAYDPLVPSYEILSPTNMPLNEDSLILSATAVEYADVWQAPCKDCEGVTVPNSTVNPYRWGIRGKWRPVRSFAYYVGRSQNNNIGEDGVYLDFNEFDWSNPAGSDPKWVSATTVTKYSPHGFELENKDAIGNYSAALYEFGESVVTAIASNARHKEIAFESFEDYAYVTDCNFQFDHWGFAPGDAIDTVTDEYHTGRYSLRVTQATGSEQIVRTLMNNDCESFQAAHRLVLAPTDATASAEYEMDDCDCVGKFSPIEGQKYVVSAWVKETGWSTPPENYAHAQIKVEFLTALNAVIGTETFTTTSTPGPIIESWQRIYGEFEVMSGTAKIRVSYVNTTATGEVCYFDDARIHPFDANMVSYVYDARSFKRVAELDANNFATFYIYDEEGQLTAVKKETISGIKTLREGRTVIKTQ